MRLAADSRVSAAHSVDKAADGVESTASRVECAVDNLVWAATGVGLTAHDRGAAADT
jgi:hypothetical protein